MCYCKVGHASAPSGEITVLRFTLLVAAERDFERHSSVQVFIGLSIFAFYTTPQEDIWINVT